MNGIERDAFARVPDFLTLVRDRRLLAYEWELLLAFDGRTMLGSLADRIALDRDLACDVATALVAGGLAERAALTYEEYLREYGGSRLAEQPVATQAPVAPQRVEDVAPPPFEIPAVAYDAHTSVAHDEEPAVCDEQPSAEPVIARDDQPAFAPYGTGYVAQHDEQISAQREEPIFAQHDEPISAQHDEPIVAQHEELNVAQHEEPIVAQHEEPIVAQHEEPIFAQHDEPISARRDESVDDGNDAFTVSMPWSIAVPEAAPQAADPGPDSRPDFWWDNELGATPVAAAREPEPAAESWEPWKPAPEPRFAAVEPAAPAAVAPAPAVAAAAPASGGAVNFRIGGSKREAPTPSIAFSLKPRSAIVPARMVVHVDDASAVAANAPDSAS